MSEENTPPAPPRKRGITSITIGWIAERFRKAEKIKQQLDNGTYQIDSGKVAASIANQDLKRKD